ncbi:hypothetical protein Cni_G23312 [Canna indica]|uniref:Uncharacterized protein n=1 Tax=Canna indica TaxID=4628 RepID=A0AAQ3KYA7_9LILI|nr:hypothetical protein Cni_G23312 [Canna indica]
MATRGNDEEAQQQQQQALLTLKSLDGDDEMTPIQKAISQTFMSASHLAKLLPTGTVLAFQLLSPIFTNSGNCLAVNRLMTAYLIVLCALSCLFLSFSDSFRDEKGNVRYGFATFRGLWVIDGTAQLPPDRAMQYKIKFIDFIHAFASISVFAAVALFDQNVVSCFYPIPSEETKQVLTCLPVGIGFFSSMLFVTFPTTRHGIGFPLSPN